MKPLVSILIPAYNAEPWIAETLHSAIAQTWERKEIIVVDDGSRDGTAAVARRFESAAVKVVVKENGGAAAARNHALQLAQGDFIQWLDADDLLSPNKLEAQLTALEDPTDRRTLLSCPWGAFSFRKHRAAFRPTALWSDLSPADWLVHKLGGNLHQQTATWLTSRELTTAAGPWDTRLLSDDDGEYFARVLLASRGTRFVPEARVFYRITPASRLSYIGRSQRKVDAMALSMNLHVGYLRSLEDSPRTRAACVRYLQTWYAHFYQDWPARAAELEALAAKLGGQLNPPHLGWKYEWIRRLFGWQAAKEARLRYNETKLSLLRAWDQMMHRLSPE